jgi:hypothetical protein
VYYSSVLIALVKNHCKRRNRLVVLRPLSIGLGKTSHFFQLRNPPRLSHSSRPLLSLRLEAPENHGLIPTRLSRLIIVLPLTWKKLRQKALFRSIIVLLMRNRPLSVLTKNNLVSRRDVDDIAHSDKQRRVLVYEQQAARCTLTYDVDPPPPISFATFNARSIIAIGLAAGRNFPSKRHCTTRRNQWAKPLRGFASMSEVL